MPIREAEPSFVNERVSSTLVPMLTAPSATVWPVPAIVPLSLQVRAPVTVSVPVPVKVPPMRSRLPTLRLLVPRSAVPVLILSAAQAGQRPVEFDQGTALD